MWREEEKSCSEFLFDCWRNCGEVQDIGKSADQTYNQKERKERSLRESGGLYCGLLPTVSMIEKGLRINTRVF